MHDRACSAAQRGIHELEEQTLLEKARVAALALVRGNHQRRVRRARNVHYRRNGLSTHAWMVDRHVDHTLDRVPQFPQREPHRRDRPLTRIGVREHARPRDTSGFRNDPVIRHYGEHGLAPAVTQGIDYGLNEGRISDAEQCLCFAHARG